MTNEPDAPLSYIPRDAKANGAYYTPNAVVRSLVSWAVRDETDVMLDPSCGDGRFLMGHVNSVGVEQDPRSAAVAKMKAPGALIHEGDFFRWASHTEARFECAAGNPPFIRYQRFKGEVRKAAIALCAQQGASFTGLASSWAPFLVAAGSLVKQGGRMAFVVPAEIGHAPYAAPLIEWLCARFRHVQVIAVREKLFPDLSEDCWLLYAEGAGEQTTQITLTVMEQFSACNAPPPATVQVPLAEWRTTWNRRLRPFLISAEARALYSDLTAAPTTRRLGDMGTVGIGYVSGANDFFHLRPSEAKSWGIPNSLLQPVIRNGRMLPADVLTRASFRQLLAEDAPVQLLRLKRGQNVPAAVRRYLDSSEGEIARTAYKCRVREPWYAVPDVKIPNFFLSYMSGRSVNLVRNDAKASCPNTLHCLTLKDQKDTATVEAVRATPFFQLSCELEGHPLGGGMLKLEPREAARIAIPDPRRLAEIGEAAARDVIENLQRWRHYSPEPLN
ncbi:N-6 DNA methylase [Thioclava sp. DLFJ4-1]|uniref:N-6 DNA methylase n=1 Tax=Thioclava sp. DLFJ4-1 TaxID=1915313 RepID=UPI000998B54D|nr:N-6 DNA methylase [Thioclava sp. DLFJ4-1]OOY14469.1 SAM-dependent methyltransferase [Thioclava sp. DLFJ4-1]